MDSFKNTQPSSPFSDKYENPKNFKQIYNKHLNKIKNQHINERKSLNYDIHQWVTTDDAINDLDDICNEVSRNFGSKN